MYRSQDYYPSILFEPQIIEFIMTQPKTVANYSALLSHHYYFEPLRHDVTKHWDIVRPEFYGITRFGEHESIAGMAVISEISCPKTECPKK
jgi:hypothetical protein